MAPTFGPGTGAGPRLGVPGWVVAVASVGGLFILLPVLALVRSEERRVGKECS